MRGRWPLVPGDYLVLNRGWPTTARDQLYGDVQNMRLNKSWKQARLGATRPSQGHLAVCTNTQGTLRRCPEVGAAKTNVLGHNPCIGLLNGLINDTTRTQTSGSRGAPPPDNRPGVRHPGHPGLNAASLMSFNFPCGSHIGTTLINAFLREFVRIPKHTI